MKKSRLATAAVAAVVVGTIGFSVPAFGASGYGAVNVEKTDNVVTIGNDALSRTFSIKDNKLKPGKIVRVRTLSSTLRATRKSSLFSSSQRQPA